MPDLNLPGGAEPYTPRPHAHLLNASAILIPATPQAGTSGVGTVFRRT